MLSDTSTGAFVTDRRVRTIGWLRLGSSRAYAMFRNAKPMRCLWFARTIGMVIAVPIVAFGQEPRSNLGLPAVAAIGVHAGFARLERSTNGEEAGLLLDLGWLRGRRIRLQGEVAFLRASLTEHLTLEDSTFSGSYFDLSVGATALWLIAGDSRVSPYALAGFAVHALSSAFQNSVLDQRYNANRFGSHVGAGLRVRLGSSRQALFAEARRVIADQVDRTVVRFGIIVLMNDLYHRISSVR